MGKQWSLQEDQDFLAAVETLPAMAEKGHVMSVLKSHLARWPGRTESGLYTHLVIIADKTNAGLMARVERVRLAVRELEREMKANARRARHFNPAPDPDPVPAAVPPFTGSASEPSGETPEDESYRRFHGIFIDPDGTPAEEISGDLVGSFNTGKVPVVAPATPATDPDPAAPEELIPPPDVPQGFVEEMKDLCQAYRRWPGLITPEAFARAVLAAVNRLPS